MSTDTLKVHETNICTIRRPRVTVTISENCSVIEDVLNALIAALMGLGFNPESVRERVDAEPHSVFSNVSFNQTSMPPIDLDLPPHYDNPEHPLHGKPTIRRDSGLIEVKCEHGVGHPIPESVEWMDKFGSLGAEGTWGIHGCDGCCMSPEAGG